MFITLINFSGVQYTHYFGKLCLSALFIIIIITPVNTQKELKVCFGKGYLIVTTKNN